MRKRIRREFIKTMLLWLLIAIPDKVIINYLYKRKTKHSLNLNNPIRYTEKIQWYKLNYRKPEITICSDKVTVKDYLKEKGYDKYINDIIAIYDKPKEIDFSSLPKSFVIKISSGSGTNIIIDDISKYDRRKIRQLLKIWMIRPHKTFGREWGYENCRRRIIIEKMILRDENNDIPDYKFFCFGGQVFCVYLMIDYIDNHKKGKLGFFDRDFNQLKYRRLDYGVIDKKILKPKNFDLMVEIADDLSKDFPHVRIDMFNMNGTIYIGEMTFYNASGFTTFYPDEFDYILGEQFDLEALK